MNTAHLKSLMINDEGFAFDPRNGNTYSLNATGLHVVQCVKDGQTPETIRKQLTKRFDVDEQTADRDLEAFLNELARHKLIETEMTP